MTKDLLLLLFNALVGQIANPKKHKKVNKSLETRMNAQVFCLADIPLEFCYYVSKSGCFASN